MAGTLAQKPQSPAAALRLLLLHLLLFALAALVLVPTVWLVCASFKTQRDVFDYTFLPWDHFDRLTLANFRTLFARTNFGRWLFNSLFLASAQTVAAVTLSSLGGFALAKYRFRGRKPLLGVMLATLLLPWQVLLPANAELMSKLGWINSYAAILVPGAVSVFGVFLFMQAMKGVPDELLHAGRVDGCSELRLWWEVALPVVRPMTAAYALLTFLASWNSFLWPQVVLQDEGNYTLPLGLNSMIGVAEFEAQSGVLMAGTLLAVLPVMALFLALQKEFIAGLTSGAVKG